MKKITPLLFFLLNFFPCFLFAQPLPLKCGMYYATGWHKEISSGKCGTNTFTTGGDEYYVHRGMTLASIEDQISQGIYYDWKGVYNLSQYSCNITRKDSSQFDIQCYGRAKCWLDNTYITLQCLASFKLKIEEPCENSGPGDPSVICVSNRIKGFTPQEKILWSGTEKEAPDFDSFSNIVF